MVRFALFKQNRNAMIKSTSVLSLLIILGSSSFAQSKNISTEKNMETEQIKKTLFTYRDALIESSSDKAVALYSRNGIFMPSGAPTAIGTAQVREAYAFVFSAIQLSIEFNIDEIEVIGNYAIARTTSKSTTLIHASGQTIPEENRELFVLKKEDGSWKIDRYIFNKMN
jgi:ketosteroid isomerase-like protein